MVKHLGPSYGRKLSPSQSCGVMAEPSESHDCRETQPELELQQKNRAAGREGARKEIPWFLSSHPLFGYSSQKPEDNQMMWHLRFSLLEHSRAEKGGEWVWEAKGDCPARML